jgi:uncharacterized protein involved in type VI secretion and phage assembly
MRKRRFTGRARAFVQGGVEGQRHIVTITVQPALVYLPLVRR